MLSHASLSDQDLRSRIKSRDICFAGNRNLLIFGTLHCASGRRMHRKNRVFFATIHEAIRAGYRPCGNCMPEAYLKYKMDLFKKEGEEVNLLPRNGTVNYYGKVFSIPQADHFFDTLMTTIAWKNDEAVIYGKRIITKRKVAWYGDSNFDYTYSKTTKQALPWTKELRELKALVEAKTGEKFNSCLLNLYHSGEEGMAWHSDAEKALRKNGAIASLSFGAERKFGFKHKETKEKIFLILEHGSLLVMKDETQTYWLHRLPPTKLVKRPRINLTFRFIETD